MVIQVLKIPTGYIASDGRMLYAPEHQDFDQAMEAIYSRFSEMNPQEREIYNHISKSMK